MQKRTMRRAAKSRGVAKTMLWYNCSWAEGQPTSPAAVTATATAGGGGGGGDVMLVAMASS